MRTLSTDTPRASAPSNSFAEWHAREPDSVAAELETSASVGLDETEAAQRLSACGPNELEAAPAIPWWRLLLEQFENALILILLVGTFRNRWLNLAVAWEIALLTLVINVPLLEQAFGTTDLSPGRWALIVGAALTIVPVLELGKLLVRRSSADGAEAIRSFSPRGQG